MSHSESSPMSRPLLASAARVVSEGSVGKA